MKSELFIECAKNVVDFYNLTQESIGSKNRMEYPKVIEERKPREWYEIKTEKDHTQQWLWGERYLTKEDASRFAKKIDLVDYEIIKVREVIE